MGVQRQRQSRWVIGRGARGAPAAPEQLPPGRRRLPGSAEGTARPSACARLPPRCPFHGAERLSVPSRSRQRTPPLCTGEAAVSSGRGAAGRGAAGAAWS